MVSRSLIVAVLLALALPMAPAGRSLPARAAPLAPGPAGSWPLRPAPPEVVAPFDPPAEPWAAGHRGVDLLGSPGQAVRTALPGRVTYAGPIAGRGVVVVDHGATRTSYEPVSAVVHPGDTVPSGGRIGHLELSGSHCFPRACLHWGWLRDRTYLDPLGLVGATRVRLLPLVGGLPPTRALTSPWAGWRPLAQALGCACW